MFKYDLNNGILTTFKSNIFFELNQLNSKELKESYNKSYDK